MFDPIIDALSEALGVPPNAVMKWVIIYIKAGAKDYFVKLALLALAIFAVIFVIRMLGLLNSGNLNGKYSPKNMEKAKNSPLAGKNIVFLGSSVTKGFAAYGKSFVDMIAARTGANCVKEAVSGTTLVDDNAKSYVARLKALDPKTPCDLFVCQLSTNDATKKKPLGKVAAAGEAYDTKTVCGAIEYIIDYAKKTWNCPIVFYTNPEYASPAYGEMVNALNKIAKKWGIEVINLWNDAELNQKCYKKRSYMNDQIHPTRKGYALWTPVMEEALTDAVVGKPLPKRAAKETNSAAIKKAATKKTIVKSVVTVVVVVLVFAIICAICALAVYFGSAGTFNPGNSDAYNPENLTAYENSPLEGKTILFLGSSVTQGYAAENISFVDYIAKLDSVNAIKEVYSGTTVTTLDENSYLPRLMKYDASTAIDAIVVQLSSNDSTLLGTDYGVLGDTFNIDDFDTSTYIGSMEAIIAYAKQTWGEDIPIVIYANSKFRPQHKYESDMYKLDGYYDMVLVTEKIAEKWGVTFMNMWDDEEMLKTTNAELKVYFADCVHCTKKGYLEYWTPQFEKTLYQLFE